MSGREFKRMVSRSSFLMDWQKDRLIAMLDNGELEDDDGNGLDGNGLQDTVFPVIDNVLWRMMGVGLDSLPPMDRIGIEQAVREIAH